MLVKIEVPFLTGPSVNGGNGASSDSMTCSRGKDDRVDSPNGRFFFLEGPPQNMCGFRGSWQLEDHEF